MAKNKSEAVELTKPQHQSLLAEIVKLKAQLHQLEQTREEQVEELLEIQKRHMSDIAELLTRCIR